MVAAPSTMPRGPPPVRGGDTQTSQQRPGCPVRARVSRSAGTVGTPPAAAPATSSATASCSTAAPSWEIRRASPSASVVAAAPLRAVATTTRVCCQLAPR